MKMQETAWKCMKMHGNTFRTEMHENDFCMEFHESEFCMKIHENTFAWGFMKMHENQSRGVPVARGPELKRVLE